MDSAVEKKWMRHVRKLQQDGLPRRCHHILPYLLQKQKPLPRFSQWCSQFFVILPAWMQIYPHFFIFSTSFLSTLGPAGPDSQADLELDGCMSSRYRSENLSFPLAIPPFPANFLHPYTHWMLLVLSSPTFSLSLPVSSPQIFTSLSKGLFCCSSKAEFYLHSDFFSF